MSSSAVAVGGMIGWVGLIVPHIARMLTGPDYSRMLPCSMLTGPFPSDRGRHRQMSLRAGNSSRRTDGNHRSAVLSVSHVSWKEEFYMMSNYTEKHTKNI